MQTPEPLLSFPYKLPKWISLFFAVLIPLGLAGVYYQATTTGFKTCAGTPVNPAVMWFFISVLVLSWLAALRIFQLSFNVGLRLSINSTGITMPKHAFTSELITIPYTQIASIAPHILKPDILILKTKSTQKTYTIQCSGFPTRAAFDQVKAQLLNL